jgi:uncharacterized coiled-coil protein SlyX
MDLDARLTELEIRYTHLEQQFQELSGVVFDQQKTIASLIKEVTALRGRILELGDPIANEKPPHY